MKNVNVFPGLADRLSHFNKAVWTELTEAVRQTILAYRPEESCIVGQHDALVDTLYKAIEKHYLEFMGIYKGQDLEQAIFELQGKNKTAWAKELEKDFDAVYTDFVRIFPLDEYEIAKRLDSRGFDAIAEQLDNSGGFDTRRRKSNINHAIRLVGRIAHEQKEDKKQTRAARAQRRKTPPQLLKETRERQAVKELAKNPNITAKALGANLGCDKSTIVRLKAWQNKGVLSSPAPVKRKDLQ